MPPSKKAVEDQTNATAPPSTPSGNDSLESPSVISKRGVLVPRIKKMMKEDEDVGKVRYIHSWMIMINQVLNVDRTALPLDAPIPPIPPHHAPPG